MPNRCPGAPPPRVSRTGRWVQLVPVSVVHHEFLYDLATGEDTGFRWRFGGTVPPFEQFRDTLWSGVLTQFVVLERTSQAPVGLVVAYNGDLNNGIAYLGAVMARAVQGSGIAVDALLLFVRYVFDTWSFRKLYLEVPEFNMPAMDGGTRRWFVEEGRMQQCIFRAGRYWDRLILAIGRETAAEMVAGRLSGRRAGRPDRR